MSNKMTFKASNTKLNKFKTKLLVVGMFENENVDKKLDQLFDNKISNAVKLESFKGNYKKKIFVYGDDINRLILMGLGKKKEYSSDKSREIAAILTKYTNQLKVDSISVCSSSFLLSKADFCQSLTEGFILGNYEFLDYKSSDNKGNSLKSVTYLGSFDKDAQSFGHKVAESVNYARSLGNHPANIMTPSYLAKEAKSMSKDKNMKAKIIDVKEFEKLGLGSFYGVARGAKEPAKLIIVEYNGGNKKDKPLALVGKGVTFDTGGISIKPSPSMDEMKFDMCGSSVVMGVLRAITLLKPKINLVFAVGATENMPGSDAQRPGDIVTAYNGKTIEVLNTDAEGRLVLADVLSYVEKNYNPNSIIDFATLTGAVLIALGDQASAIMGNSDALINEIKKSSKKTDEKVWELPLWDVYSKDIKSKIADVKNLGRSRLAGTIAGGVFLKEFVNDTPWVHMDIAGTAWGPKEPLYLPSNGATGVAVRLICNLIKDRIK